MKTSKEKDKLQYYQRITKQGLIKPNHRDFDIFF